MRIFPEGAEEWLEPTGTAMQVLAGMLLLGAIGAFCFRLLQTSTWNKVEGQVISADLVKETADNGQIMCSAEYRVRYVVGGSPYVLATRFKSSSNDCAAWKQRVRQLPSSRMTLLYPSQSPEGATVYSDWFEFHLVSIVCVFLSLAFAIAGTVSKMIGRKMLKERLQMP